MEEIFKKKADYYDDALTQFTEYRRAAYGTGLELLKWIADLAIFSLMGSYDLWITICDYMKATKRYQQNYYTRQAALTCF